MAGERGQNLIEKIVQRFTEGATGKVYAGDYVTLRPAHVLTHDNTGAVMKKFKAIGATRMADPRQPMFALDHNVQDRSEANLKKYAAIEAFAREMGVDFYPAGRGIGHQLMLEEGYVWPYTVVVASDSHANMYGGLGAVGTPVVRTDAAALWATGRTWWQIPPVVRVVLEGALRPGVSGKDVILTLAALFKNDEVLNHVLEFTGPGVASLSLDERFTIANMTTEWGALAGVFPADEATFAWLEERIRRAESQGEHPRWRRERLEELRRNPLSPDENAYYAGEVRLDLSTVEPFVAGPDQVKNGVPVSELAARRIKIHKAYLVSCVNSRVSDLAAAAEVLRGKKVAPGVEFYIAAASAEVQRESEKRGDWQALLEAGAIPLPPGCGPCIGLGKGLLEDGEVGISATNRNFKGRMGSRDAQAYLASPAVVAASAAAGYITGPATEAGTGKVKAEFVAFEAPAVEQREVQLLPDFPGEISGRVVFCPQDNLNTDGIYPGKYTYRDDFTPAQQAEVVMENYDPRFRELVREGDILVGGFNFGTGSSREQAATALKYRGLALVIAGSFSQTYRRNAINNGFITLTAPEFVKELKIVLGTDQLTIVSEDPVRIDFARAVLEWRGKEYPFEPLGPAAQEIILAGGLENWVKRKIE